MINFKVLHLIIHISLHILCKTTNINLFHISGSSYIFVYSNFVLMIFVPVNCLAHNIEIRTQISNLVRRVSEITFIRYAQSQQFRSQIITKYVLLFTACDYPCGILDLRLVITPWYLRFTACDYPCGILDLRLVITPVVSQIYGL